MSPRLNSESFKEWANDEESGESHSSDASFTQWLKDEVRVHGDIPLSQWGREETEESEHHFAENPYSPSDWGNYQGWEEDEDFYAEQGVNWIRLQGLGRVPAVKAETLKCGDWIGWNRGYSSEVLDVKPKGSKSLTLTIRSREGGVHKITKRRDTLIHIIKPRMVKHWRAENFNAYGFGETEGSAVFGKYSMRDLLESIAGPQGRLSYQESSAWDYRSESKAKPSYSPSVKLKSGITMSDDMKMMKSAAVLAGAMLIGYNWDMIMTRVKGALGRFASESEIARREIAEDAHYSVGQVSFQGGNGGMAANEQSPAPVKFDYNPVAGPTQMTFDPATMPRNILSFE